MHQQVIQSREITTKKLNLIKDSTTEDNVIDNTKNITHNLYTKNGTHNIIT